jgi:hypothetical protein
MKRKWLIPIILIIAALLFVATIAYAQEGFDLSWWTVDSGGGQSNGDVYSLQGVAGQPDAGVLQGGDFILAGGFLSGVTAPPPPVYNLLLPLVIK